LDNACKCAGIRETPPQRNLQGIAARRIAGYRGISLCKRDAGAEVEFVTIMWFDSLDAVRAFAGEDYAVAVVPPRARAVLSRFDAVSAHYETPVSPQFPA